MKPAFSSLRPSFQAAAAFFILCAAGQAQSTALVSTAAGDSGNGRSTRPAISADGQRIAFQSLASDLVAGDTNGVSDVFLRDMPGGAIARCSVSSAGLQGDQPSIAPAISGDGRFVAFQSNSTNLVAGDTNQASDVFVHDRATGSTRRVSVDAALAQGNGSSGGACLSADGRFVAFRSLADNLVPGDTNGSYDVFVVELASGQISRVSVSSAGAQATPGLGSDRASLSADGRLVAFDSDATNLVGG